MGRVGIVCSAVVLERLCLQGLLEFAFSYSRCYLLCYLILIDQQGVMRAMRGCSAGTQDLAC